MTAPVCDGNAFGPGDRLSGMILPAGSRLPPLPYAVAIVLAVAAVGWTLHDRGVALDDRTVLALAPWMIAGSTAYVAFQREVLPAVLAPAFSSPAVYGTTFAVAGGVWLVARRHSLTLRLLAGAGCLAALLPTAAAVLSADGELSLVAPLGGVVVAAALSWVTWRAIAATWPAVDAAIGRATPLVVFAHALDGVSTAVGIDLLGFDERTPLSWLVMEAAARLPTAEAIGVGWLFVLVKLALAAVVLRLLAGYVREEPGEGYALVALGAAVGLGPGAHNVLLFVIAAPTAF